MASHNMASIIYQALAHDDTGTVGGSAGDGHQDTRGGGGRGLHTSTSRLNVSAFCGIGGTFRGCLGVFNSCQGVLGDV